MSILQLAAIKIGQTGLQPNSFKMLTTDSLATITTAGYLKQGTAGQSFLKNDVIETIYNYGLSNATNIELTVSIDTLGVITLGVSSLPGSITVTGSVTSGHVATFASSSSIQDGGAFGTAASKSASDNTKATLASVSGSTITGHLLTAADTAGTVNDAGLSIKSFARAPYAGGSATAVFTDAACTNSSNIVASWATQTNPASILTVTEGVGSFTVVSTADPGVSKLNYILTN